MVSDAGTCANIKGNIRHLYFATILGAFCPAQRCFLTSEFAAQKDPWMFARCSEKQYHFFIRTCNVMVASCYTKQEYQGVEIQNKMMRSCQWRPCMENVGFLWAAWRTIVCLGVSGLFPFLPERVPYSPSLLSCGAIWLYLFWSIVLELCPKSSESFEPRGR